MVNDLDPQNFDIIDAITGRSYPEITVPVYFDEALAYSISQYQEKLVKIPAGKEYDAAVTEFESLVASLNEQKYTFTVRGIPLDVQQNIFKKVKAKFEPAKKSGKDIDQDAVAEEYLSNLWAAHVVKIENPAGGVQVPSPKTMKAFRAGAPAHAIASIDSAIEALSIGAKSGFERAARDVDFLSGASPEA